MVNSADMESSSHSLLNNVLANRHNAASNGKILNDLLEAFRSGFPIENLRKLLSSDDPLILRAAVWILSELGSKSCEFFDEVESLIESDDARIRFLLADCILICSGQEHPTSLARLARLVEDPDAAVRWKALDVLTRLREDQVRACLSWMLVHDPRESYIEGLTMLLEATVRKQSDEEVCACIASPDAVLKRLAFVSAARAGYDTDRLRELASKSNDLDIQKFAEDFVVAV